jgi:cytoskeletal protein RodZ
MRRVAVYGIGWLAAATLAILLAWQGVARVGTDVTNRHPRPLTADQAREALGRPTGVPAGPAPAPTDAGPPGTGPAASTTTTTTRPTVTTATTRPSSPPTTATTRPAGPAPTSPPAPAPAPAAETRTYNLIGGSVTLRFSPSGVSVVWADPNPGFRAEVDNRSDGGVRVRFESDSHRSEVEAWWDGGPQDRVQEEGGDGGGSGH